MLVWFLVSSFGPMGANKKDAPANQIFAVARLIACCPGIGPERWWRKLNNTAYPLRASHPRTKRPTIPLDPIPAALQSAMEPTARELFGRGCWEPFITAYIKMNGGREEARPSASLVVSFRVSPDGSRIGSSLGDLRRGCASSPLRVYR